MVWHPRIGRFVTAAVFVMTVGVASRAQAQPSGDAVDAAPAATEPSADSAEQTDGARPTPLVEVEPAVPYVAPPEPEPKQAEPVEIIPLDRGLKVDREPRELVELPDPALPELPEQELLEDSNPPLAYPRASPPPPDLEFKSPYRTLIVGDTFTAIGIVGRVALEVYWGTAGKVRPEEKFGRWSVPNIIAVTNVNNLFAGTGLALITAGTYRRGLNMGLRDRKKQLGPEHDAMMKKRYRDSWIVLGTGLFVYLTSRAAFIPVAEACPNNACAYGFLEGSYWASAALIYTGACLTAFWGARRKVRRMSRQPSATAPRWALMPLASDNVRGLGVAGTF